MDIVGPRGGASQRRGGGCDVRRKYDYLVVNVNFICHGDPRGPEYRGANAQRDAVVVVGGVI